jgi:hypothetical protein
MDHRNRDYYQELSRLQTRAQAVSTRLGQLPRPMSPVGAAEYDKAIELATDLGRRAAAPISIGLVGEYSVGKSRLLNTVLNLPGLLPESAAPMTGNITALRIHAAKPGQQPGAQSAQVSYMSRRELGGVARFMLNSLRSLINGKRLQYNVGSRGYNPVADGWEPFEKLARDWWQHEEFNHEVGLYAWELLRLRNAMLYGANLLRVGRPINVDLKLIRDGIEIGSVRKVPSRFPERPGKRPVLADAPLTAEVLAGTFPLIRRIVLDVAVEPGLLPLNGLRESNGLELLDFAGLNAAGAVRDEYLCDLELERITGYLEVVNASHAETKTATTFKTSLEGRRKSKATLAHSALLVANKFDKVEVVPPRDTVAELTDMTAFGSMLRLATGLTSQLRHFALTSAVGPRADRDWKPVAAALRARPQDSAEERLASALDDYAADGGISRLRDMLSKHIADKALPVMVTELNAHEDELEAVLRRLRATLVPISPPPADDSDQKLLGELVVGLNQMISDAKTAAAAFRDADAIKIAARDESAPGTASGLFDRINEQAVLLVYPWPEWTAVFGRFGDGQIRPPVSPASTRDRMAGDEGRTGDGGLDDNADLDDDDRLDNDADFDDDGFGRRDWRRVEDHSAAASLPEPDGTGIPMTTTDFVAPFRGSLSELQTQAQELAQHVVTEWVSELHNRHAALRDQLADQRTSALLARGLTALDADGGVERLRKLAKIGDLNWVPSLFDELLTTTEKRADSAGANAFPLAPDHALPWNVEKADSMEPADLLERRHPSRALRLRYELANGLAFPVRAGIAMAFGSLEAELDWQLGELLRQVPGQATLLQAASAADAGEAAAPGHSEMATALDDLLADTAPDRRAGHDHEEEL